MKKFYALITILTIPAILLITAFTTGPDAGYSGSPLDGANCTSCHVGFPAVQVQNLIEINVGPNGYVGGQTYDLTVICTNIASSKMGFQITSENEDGKVGLWTVIDTRTQLKGGTAVTHTAEGTVPVGTPNSWSMHWTAPAAGTGPVSFYVAINKTNANNQVIGDEIFLSSLTIQESGVGIAENLDQSIGSIYPNPANDKIHLNIPDNSVIRIFDNMGREVISVTNDQTQHEIDVSALQQGIYFVQIAYEGQYASRRFVKR